MEDLKEHYYGSSRYGFEVEKIKKTPEGFRLESAGEGLSCDRLIIAAGGLVNYINAGAE